ncbi:MAG TPA: sialidase family protein [Candidatus Dormibacteraeota bacterium]|nr:sialidase family protein [Candidatus Dormibacteraeota bacterium]
MRARGAAFLAATLALAGCDNGTANNEPSLPPPQLISGAVALSGDCSTGAATSGLPGEPTLAADPTNPKQLIAAWLDNRQPDRAGIIVAVTDDGGKHWDRTSLPDLLRCNGGPYVHVTDPWISIGPDGIVYLSTLAIRPATPAGTPRDISVSVSRDHGASWDPSVVVETATAPPASPDKEAVFADTRHPGIAYAGWADYQVTSGIEPSLDSVRFARTIDSGKTWSTPVTLYSGHDEAQDNQLLMTAGGVLLDVFVEGSSLPGTANAPPIPVKVRVMRSKDQGQTWSQPIDAASFTYTTGVDPGTGKELRFSGQNIAATVSGNAVYASFFEDHKDFSTILTVRSDDAGLHWRPAHIAVRERSAAFLPTLAVAGDGTLGMLWFDLRHYVASSPRLDTDVWFSSSGDRGAHWMERHAAGPFDLRSAPSTRYGPFIGDYMGLVGLPDGFGAAFVMARPQSRNGPTDVFFTRIRG